MSNPIRFEEVAGSCRAYPSGDLDLNTEPRIRKALFNALEARPDQLVIDLRDVTFIDSSGLRVLLSCRNRCEELGTRLLLAGVGPDIERTLQVANLKNFFAYE